MALRRGCLKQGPGLARQLEAEPRIPVSEPQKVLDSQAGNWKQRGWGEA